MILTTSLSVLNYFKKNFFGKKKEEETLRGQGLCQIIYRKLHFGPGTTKKTCHTLWKGWQDRDVFKGSRDMMEADLSVAVSWRTNGLMRNQNSASGLEEDLSSWKEGISVHPFGLRGKKLSQEMMVSF